jgi:Xaa-Pro dipeptidase
MNSELETKTERIVKMIHDEALDAVLLNTQHNFAWLTCGGSNGIDVSRENGAGFLLVTKDGGRYVLANNIEIVRLMSEELPAYSKFEPIEITWQAEKDPQAIRNAAKSVAGGDKLGCDVGFPETLWIEPSIASCRYELTTEEIERFRSVGHDAGEAINNVIAKLIPGQSENEVARIVRIALSRYQIFSVVTLIAGDERISKYRHPVPTDNIWKNTLLIVICARRNGLIASLSRIICAGDIPSDLQRKTVACAAVNTALYDSTRIGATGSELYSVAAAAYEDQGFGDEIGKHHQGGAAGYRTRDWVAHPASTDVVRPNQAFAWNPSITGTKTEETTILTDAGLEVITSSPGFPTISTVLNGCEYFSPGILSLTKGATA